VTRRPASVMSQVIQNTARDRPLPLIDFALCTFKRRLIYVEDSPNY